MRDLKQSSKVFLCDGPQIRQSQNEENIGDRTAKDRTERGKSTMGKVEDSQDGEAQDWEEAVSDKKTVAIYVRVSTNDQNLAMQEEELRQYCERRG